MECEYCKKVFKNKGTLKTHQNNAKYCLHLRNNQNDNFICKHCSKNLSSKQTLEQHTKKCSKNVDAFHQQEIEIELLKKELEISNKTMEEYRLQIKHLQDKLSEMIIKGIEKPTTIEHNQTTNQSIKNIDNRTVNMIPWNLIPELFQKTLEEKFSETHFLKGQKGVAEFMLENILIQGELEEEKKYLMKCTDSARKTFITLDEQGKIQKDINAENLTRLISDPVKEKCQEIYKNIHNNYLQTYESLGNELEEGDPDQERLEYIGAKFEHATDKVVEIARLKNNNSEFVKNLIPSLSV